MDVREKLTTNICARYGWRNNGPVDCAIIFFALSHDQRKADMVTPSTNKMPGMMLMERRKFMAEMLIDT